MKCLFSYQLLELTSGPVFSSGGDRWMLSSEICVWRVPKRSGDELRGLLPHPLLLPTLLLGTVVPMEVSPRECFQGWWGQPVRASPTPGRQEVGASENCQGFLEAYESWGHLAFWSLLLGDVWNLEEGGPSGDTSSLVVNPEDRRVFLLGWRGRLSSCSFSSLTAGHHKPTHLPFLQPALVKSNYAFWEIRSFWRLFLWETLELRKAGSHRLLGGQSLPGLPAPHFRGECSCSESSKKPNK